jgi:hypothetical protein
MINVLHKMYVKQQNAFNVTNLKGSKAVRLGRIFCLHITL